jgi:hypothetical protein
LFFNQQKAITPSKPAKVRFSGKDKNKYPNLKFGDFNSFDNEKEALIILIIACLIRKTALYLPPKYGGCSSVG